MKDFHDLWALSSAFGFEGPVLRQALVACFDRRGTAWSETPPDVLRSSFYENVLTRRVWRDYLASGSFVQAPPAGFDVVGGRLLAFVGPVRDSIVAGVLFERHWPAGGPWQTTASAREGGEGVV